MNLKALKPFLFLLTIVVMVSLACGSTTPSEPTAPPPAQHNHRLLR